MSFFHVGLTKSASTTLQRYFEDHQQIDYSDRYELVSHLMPASDLYLDAERTPKYLDEELRAKAIGVREALATVEMRR